MKGHPRRRRPRTIPRNPACSTPPSYNAPAALTRKSRQVSAAALLLHPHAASYAAQSEVQGQSASVKSQVTADGGKANDSEHTCESTHPAHPHFPRSDVSAVGLLQATWHQSRLSLANLLPIFTPGERRQRLPPRATCKRVTLRDASCETIIS